MATATTEQNGIARFNEDDERSLGATTEMAVSRQAQEVQAAMIVAKRFPRDENAAYDKIMRACKRKSLAENAMYAYPRGGQTVTGPSIRLAEVLAQNWGNLDFGIIELEQANGESQMMAYCWDLETNTRQTKIFAVKHLRSTKRGTYALTDPRDIYELSANQGARRLRACILGVIPGDIVDEAVGQCEKTLAGNSSEPLADRVRKCVSAFGDFNIGIPQIEARLGHKIGTTSETELVTLRKLFLSIRDNMADPAELFPLAGTEQPEDGGNKGERRNPSSDELADSVAGSANAKPQDSDSAGETTFDRLMAEAVAAEGEDEIAAVRRKVEGEVNSGHLDAKQAAALKEALEGQS